METDQIYNIFLTIVLAILFLAIVYSLTPYSNYRLFLRKLPTTIKLAEENNPYQEI
mgnify:CR=1 FL=1